MADGPPGPVPRPPFPALAAILGPREALPPIYRDLIERLARETIPENTRRALESNLRYLGVWKRVAIGEELAFPESEGVVARFILDALVETVERGLFNGQAFLDVFGPRCRGLTSRFIPRLTSSRALASLHAVHFDERFAAVAGDLHLDLPKAARPAQVPVEFVERAVF